MEVEESRLQAGSFPPFSEKKGVRGGCKRELTTFCH